MGVAIWLGVFTYFCVFTSGLSFSITSHNNALLIVNTPAGTEVLNVTTDSSKPVKCQVKTANSNFECVTDNNMHVLKVKTGLLNVGNEMVLIEVTPTDTTDKNSAEQNITILIKPFSFTMEMYAQTFSTDQPAGTSLLTVQAIAAPTRTVGYSLYGDADDFAINRASGVISVAVNKKLAATENGNSYIFHAMALDGTGPGGNIKTATTTVSIEVKKVVNGTRMVVGAVSLLFMSLIISIFL